MNGKKTEILLIEDDAGDAALGREILSQPDRPPVRLTGEPSLAGGLSRLKHQRFHVALLDIGLPDSQGPDKFKRLQEAAPDSPVIVLTGMDDEAQGIKLVQMGAQDYPVKGGVTGPMLHRSIRYAIERRQLMIRLEQERLKNALIREIGRLKQIHEAAFPSTTTRLMGDLVSHYRVYALGASPVQVSVPPGKEPS